MFYRYLFVPYVRTSETIKKYLRHVQRLSHTIKNIPMNNFVHGGIIKSFRNKSLQLDVVQMVTASSALVNIDSSLCINEKSLGLFNGLGAGVGVSLVPPV